MRTFKIFKNFVIMLFAFKKFKFFAETRKSLRQKIKYY